MSKLVSSLLHVHGWAVGFVGISCYFMVREDVVRVILPSIQQTIARQFFQLLAVSMVLSLLTAAALLTTHTVWGLGLRFRV